MSGLLLIGIAIAWFVVVIFVTRRIARSIESRPIKIVSAILTFVALLIAPLGDEIVGKYQFKALCRKYAVQYIDEEHAINRQVIYMPRGEDKFAEHTAVKIRIDKKEYRDVDNNRILVSYHTLHAQGGWFIRALGVSETNSPLIFNSGCAPENPHGFIKKLNMTVVN